MADAVFEGEKMYSLKSTADFDSAHFLKGYNGKCSNLCSKTAKNAECLLISAI